MQATICVLPGDGIGPEVTREAVRVLEAVGRMQGHQLAFTHGLIGGAAMDATGGTTALTEETIAMARAADAVLFGAIGGPQWDNPAATVRPEQGVLAIRRALGLFANLRPVRLSPFLIRASTIKPEVLAGTDLVVVRELTGGLYFGEPRQEATQPRGQRRAVDTLPYTEEEIARVVRMAFELARQRRKKVTSVDKANVLATSRLWRTVTTEIAQEYPDVTLEHLYVDAMSMYLVQRPASYDVIVTENLFGDILTDEAAVLAGSLGMLPSASLGRRDPARRTRMGLYEPIHGSAPGLAGQDRANPCATILSAALLLRLSLGLDDEAGRIERAVDLALERGARTTDIAEPGAPVLGTRAMGDAVLGALEG